MRARETLYSDGGFYFTQPTGLCYYPVSHQSVKALFVADWNLLMDVQG